MTISSKTLSAIQAAGQAIDAARAELVAATQDHATRVMQAVAENPFGAENDHLFNNWKAIARMSQSVQDMEAQCKAVFHAAAELAMNAEGDTAKSLRSAKPSLIGHTRVDLAPSDVQAKPSRKSLKSNASNASKAPKAAKPGQPRPLKGNAAKVMDVLRTTLNAKQFTRATQSEIAIGAGIPNGSIAAALKQLTEKGLISEGDKGHYKLA